MLVSGSDCVGERGIQGADPRHAPQETENVARSLQLPLEATCCLLCDVQRLARRGTAGVPVEMSPAKALIASMAAEIAK